MKPFLIGVAAAIVFVLSGCATEEEVRAACKWHDGVRIATGSAARKDVVCNDNAYYQVR